MTPEALHAWALLARCTSASTALLAPALATAGGAEALVAGARALLPPKLQAQLEAARARVHLDLAWLASGAAGEPPRAFVPFDSPDYPPLLRENATPPVALWVVGNVRALRLPQVAVVGTRRPTPSGRAIAHEWAERFAHAGLVVTSGLAAGIDACAHRGALVGARARAAVEAGPSGGAPCATIAVCGTGPDATYPSSNAALAADVATLGAVVSEFPPGTPARPDHFPRRNRIIAGLSLGTLVVEAASRSGSLITARLAGEQGREVWAVPGAIANPLARGCHELLRQGAKLVESADEVLADLLSSPLDAVRAGPDITGGEGFAERVPGSGALDKEYEMLLDALGFDLLDVDTLVDRTGQPAQVVSSMLLILELQGRVESRAGRFCRVTSSPGSWCVEDRCVGDRAPAASALALRTTGA